MRHGPRTIASLIFILGTLSAASFAQTTLVYVASFGGGSLEGSVDKLDMGALKLGDTGIAGTNPGAATDRGELVLSITRPVGLASGVVASSGVFATGLNFDEGSLFGLQATFIRPVGPSSGGWAAGALNARTGGAADLNGETRVNATLNVRAGGTARLNVPLGAASQTFVDVPAAAYAAIFSQTNPQPYTIRLLIDRISGNGTASLQVGDFPVLSRSFQLSQFKADSGPVIGAVGPTVANANAPGQTVSVHVRDFRIYAAKHRCPQSQPLC